MSERDHAAIQRLLMLRQFPGFDDAELSELAMIAENVVEQRFAPGATVAALAQVPALHLIVDGKLVSQTSRLEWSPREVFGALEAMAGRPAREPVIAPVSTRTLKLEGADFVEILEDNFGLLSAARRGLARSLLPASLLPVEQPRGPVLVGPEALGMVDRVLLLRDHVPFGKGRIEALAALARASEERRLPARAVLARAGDRADGPIVILEGVVRGELPGGATFVLVPGQAIGALETLAETGYATTLTALSPTRVLHCPGAALFDALEDHTDLALAMIASLAGSLLDLESADPIEVN